MVNNKRLISDGEILDSFLIAAKKGLPKNNFNKANLAAGLENFLGEDTEIENPHLVNQILKSQERTKSTGEVFTPNILVEEILDKIPIDPNKTFLDNSCGNGQFLIGILKRTKDLGWPTLENFNDYRPTIEKREVKKGILTEFIDDEIPPKKGGIFGVDLMFDNCMDTIARLQLFVKTGIDYWDDKAQPIKELNHPGHSDDHSWEYLRKYPGKYQRDYNGISVRFSHFNEGKAGVFEYSFENDEWIKCYNIVCCDALVYDYQFGK